MPRRITRVSERKKVHCLKAALSSKQAYGTPPVVLKKVGQSPRVT